MDALRLGLPRGFNIPSLPEGSLLNSPMRLFLASGGLEQQQLQRLGSQQSRPVRQLVWRQAHSPADCIMYVCWILCI